MPSKATRLRMLNDVRRRIDDYGWAVQAIGDECSVPGCCSYLRPVRDFADFGYTVGLSRYHGHPELIVTGVPQMETVRPLNLLGERVRGGERFAGGDRVEGVLADGFITLVDVDPRESVRHLVTANQLYRNPGAPPVHALQVVWPDRTHRFPWEAGYSLRESVQPLLGPPPVV